jgi:PIN domain nuclease of toxin-antitoxin system
MFNIIVDCSEVSNIDENNLRQMSEHLDIFLEVIKQEIGVITSSELFSMQSSFDDESWVLDRKKRIRLEVLNINKKITASTNQLKEIEKSI